MLLAAATAAAAVSLGSLQQVQREAAVRRAADGVAPAHFLGGPRAAASPVGSTVDAHRATVVPV